MVTVKEIKNGAKLDLPIYVSNPYVILSKGGIVLHAGTIESMQEFGSYYDDCIADIRRYDMHMNDNTKVSE
jgi:hypothetical protein